jgi:hypothetical protein
LLEIVIAKPENPGPADRRPAIGGGYPHREVRGPRRRHKAKIRPLWDKERRSPRRLLAKVAKFVAYPRGMFGVNDEPAKGMK